MLWLGIDPAWHSMGFEHFAVSCLTDPSLVEEILERIKLPGPGYGYLVSSSNSVTDCCRAENVVAMVEAVEEFGRYPLG